MWIVLCREGINGTGRPRIEMYRSEDNVSGYQPLRVIELEAVRSVQHVGKPFWLHAWQTEGLPFPKASCHFQFDTFIVVVPTLHTL